MLPDEHTNEASMTSQGQLVPAGSPAMPQPAEWYAGDYGEWGATAGGDSAVSRYLHALRRRWLIALGLGLILGLCGGLAVYYNHTPTYTTRSLIKVSSSQEKLLFDTKDSTTNFDIYKATQLQYLRSRFVLIAALRKSELAKLPSIQKAEDPVVWLSEHLQAGFPGNSEIMVVSLSGKDKEEVAALVNGVVDAYMKEVVDVEKNQRARRLNDLDKIYAEKERELNDKRTNMKVLAEQQGTGDSEALNLKQRLTMERYDTLRKAMTDVQFQIMRAEGMVKVRKNTLDRAAKQPISDAQVDAALASIPLIQELLKRRDALENMRAHSERTASPAVAARYLGQYDADLKKIDEQISAERSKVLELMEAKKDAYLQQEISDMEFQVSILEEQEKQLADDLDGIKLEAQKTGADSIELEMLKSETKLLDDLLRKIGDERQHLVVELRSRPRTEVVQPASIPQAADADRAMQFAILVGLLGLCIPGVLIVWWDARGRRVNTSAELTHNAGLEVIGSVPIIPEKATRNLDSSSRRHRRWREMLAESVDGIAARLLRKAETEQVRVVLVSSAVGGEGKTTVATQLALSLARTGKRTVLVDFDLRRPAIDQLLGIPLEPGVSEVLRKEAQASDVVREIASVNLSVVSAGRWDHDKRGVLANGVAGGFLEELREEYDFVVVDASPILPVVDARFLSRYVDGVVLAVLRDVSRIPKILSTCEILNAFGVRILGAVVTGATDDMYLAGSGYEYQQA